MNYQRIPIISVKEISNLKVIEEEDPNEKYEDLGVKFKRKLKSLNQDKLFRSYTNYKIKISPLQVSQYKELYKFNENVIHAVPELTQLDEIFYQKQNKLFPFIGFKQLSEISNMACESIEQSFNQSRNKWNQFHDQLFTQAQCTDLQSTPSKFLKSKIDDVSKSSRILRLNDSNYSNLLKHNKDQLLQILDNFNQKQETQINDTISLQKRGIQYKFTKKPKIYPSKILEEQKRQAIIRGYTDEKGQKKQIQVQLDTITHEIYFYENEQYYLKPEMREGATIITVQNNVYLFGGRGLEVFGSFWIMDQKSNKWVNNSNNQGSQQPIPRTKHTCNIVGKFMIIFGGRDQNRCYLKDIWMYDLAINRWTQVDVEIFQFFSKGIAFHQTCAIYHPIRKNNYLFKFEELKLNDLEQLKSPYQVEGIFCFGGMNQEENILQNKLHVLKTDQKPMKWIEFVSKGIQPQSRYGHTMNFVQQIGALVIYGGKNNEIFMNDLHILRLNNQSWLNVTLFNNPKNNRAFHCSTTIDSKLYIFGGYSELGYLNSDVVTVELDSEMSHSLIQKKDTRYQNNNILKSESSMIILSPQEKKMIKQKSIIEQLAFPDSNNISDIIYQPQVSQQLLSDRNQKGLMLKKLPSIQLNQ